ncbi:MAG: PAS domain S-box protein [Bradyrhizobium sp.]|nr:PAS domain S-box protein [Pseudomonadota bacterium]MDE2068290.1 PAS domain S-box protein [Bradyrhizobium sp.]MDE2243472.1 PAS domain S-box protein [Bradyrhizobium sp.]
MVPNASVQGALVQTGADIFLSTMPATRRDSGIALAVVGISAILFACIVPFAGMPLAPVPAFVASYQSALAINDLITAVLLFSQFAVLRSWALLLLASGYLFTAAAAVAHGLTFPGLFTPTGLFGSGSQTTVWLYMIWHGGFPLFVLGYALLKNSGGGPRIAGSIGWIALASVIAVIVTMVAMVWLVTGGHDRLPILLSEGHYTSAMIDVVSAVWLLCLAALFVLWLRRPHSLVDVWLMVALCAWLFDIALSAIVNVARFDLGFYFGRVYGLCAASFVLAVLLFDNVALQARLSHLLAMLRRQAADERDHHSERERLFSAVVESSHDAIILLTLDGTITGWNKAAERLSGFTAAEAVGNRIDIVIPPELQDRPGEMLEQIARGEAIEQLDTVRLRKDGSRLDISLVISPIRSRTGEVVGASAIARDIGERKRAQQALNQQIEERRRIFETSQDLILVTDTEGTFVQVSPSSMTILGYQPPEMIGHTAIKFIHPDDLEGTRNEMRSARRGRQIRNFEARYVHKDGRLVTLTWMGTWSEPVQRYFFVGRDLTEKQATEAQFRQAQKMEAVGQLTGGIAHDFNNILTVITGTIGILGEAVADRPELETITRMIDEAAERGGQLTKHLLAFARKQPLQPRETDINNLVLETVKLLRPTLGEHIQIDPSLADDTWPALIDPNQLTTAILNLALNGRDAMPSGGSLVIETKNTYLDEAYAAMNIEVTPGPYVMIAVSDTGSGIAPRNLERVFDPFFTTKDVGKGTGLGLSMVYGLVKQSNGHIKIYSEQGHGTSVKMYLPRATKADPGATEMPALAPVRGGHEAVLIVEDDALVRKLVVTQICSLGYTALEASNAAEALAAIRSNAAIDLLLTDVIMPGSMNGRQLADEAVKQRPSLKTLFTSGYTENAIVHHGRLDAGVLLLAKPYRKPELARMIRMALDIEHGS